MNNPLDWNLAAVNFYKKHGAAIERDGRHFRFTGEAFEKLTEKSF